VLEWFNNHLRYTLTIFVKPTSKQCWLLCNSEKSTQRK